MSGPSRLSTKPDTHQQQQQQSNGVTLDNVGSGIAAMNGSGGGSESVRRGGLVNGVGGDVEEDGELVTGGLERRVRSRKRAQRQLSGMDADIVRLIGQHLREMGFNKTLDHLMDESGCALEHSSAAKFRAHVIKGEWDQANQSLDDLVPLLEDPCNVQKMRLLLLQEKYLELLEAGHEFEALQCLRHELAPLPLHRSDKNIQVLTSYMMYKDKEQLHQAAGWCGVSGGARQKLMDQLQAFLPASVMLPPRRLRQLLSQAVQLQVERCPFHYVEQSTTDYSLLSDHMCSRAQFPSESVHVLTDHSDEVWCLAFSHDGTRLASGAKDGQIIIWNNASPEPVKEHSIKSHSEGIALLAWSPDDTMLLSCGKEDNQEALVYSTQSGDVKCRVQNSSDDSLSCGAWHRSGTKFYVGGQRGQFFECSLDGAVTGSWEGIRVNSLATHPHQDLVYAADTHHRIRQYNFQDHSSSTVIQEAHSIMTFVLSRSGRHALLNVATQGVHVWDLQDRCLVRRYQGVTQGYYNVSSTYGGINDSFLASGSEDHHIYVWHHRRETPIIILKGHSRPVSCVSWNPVHHNTLASASDDGTVRIWGTEEQMKAQLHYQQEKGEQKRKYSQEQQNGAVQASDQDIVPVDGGSLSQPESLGGSGDAEGMDIQQSETSQSSTTDPQSSELERNDGSTSSLSLSSERLEEGGIVALASSDGVLTSSQRTEAGRSAMLGSRTITILSSSNNSAQQATVLQSIGSEISSIVTYEQVSSSSPHLESSVDPSSSQLSLDSSNGSSQGDVSQSESEVEGGLRFAAGSRTSSNSNLPSQAGSSERTPPSASSRSSSSLAGTSVIVEPNSSRGTPSHERSAGEGQHQQQRSSQQPPPSPDDESGSSSRPTGGRGGMSTVV